VTIFGHAGTERLADHYVPINLKGRTVMRALLLVMLLSSIGLTACGEREEKTTIVNPPPGSTVVIPPSDNARVCPPGETSC
jgi:hypothetical protein